MVKKEDHCQKLAENMRKDRVINMCGRLISVAEPCRRCNGHGRIYWPNGYNGINTEACEVCGGNGELKEQHDRCRECGVPISIEEDNKNEGFCEECKRIADDEQAIWDAAERIRDNDIYSAW